MNLPSSTTASTKRERVVRQDAQIHRTSFQPNRSSSSSQRSRRETDFLDHMRLKTLAQENADRAISCSLPVFTKEQTMKLEKQMCLSVGRRTTQPSDKLLRHRQTSPVTPAIQTMEVNHHRENNQDLRQRWLKPDQQVCTVRTNHTQVGQNRKSGPKDVSGARTYERWFCNISNNVNTSRDAHVRTLTCTYEPCAHRKPRDGPKRDASTQPHSTRGNNRQAGQMPNTARDAPTGQSFLETETRV